MRLTHGKLPFAERVEALPFLNIKYEVQSFDRLRTSGERVELFQFGVAFIRLCRAKSRHVKLSPHLSTSLETKGG